jgi:serine/threonine-protein kinase
VVHRDLKPANVMVERADAGGRWGRVVITDFGVAGSTDAGQRSTGAIGTPLYMAPEQILGDPVGAPADIYAFGVMLYEMLTGRIPFEGPTPMATALARCRVAAVDPRQHVDVPATLAELLMQCLARSPSDRPASAEEVSARLGAFARAASAQTMVAAGEEAMLAALSSSSGVESALPSTAASTPGSMTPSSGGSVSRPFAVMSVGQRALAVLPFEAHAPPEMAFLGNSLAQELVDALSRTRGLRVLAFGATRDRGAQDPCSVGRAVGADTIVAGTVQTSGERVRVSVRLIEVATGVQIYSGRFDKQLEDVIEMQEIVSQRIADAARRDPRERASRPRDT